MTYFPDYLKTYPNMDTASPLHISLNTLQSGFRAHRHDFLEFSYVVEGTGSETINEALHPMKPGTFTFVLPYQVHQIYTDPGSKLVLYNCMFGMDLLMEASLQERMLGLIDAGGAPSFIQLAGEEHERMLQLLHDMYGEYRGGEPWRHTMLQLRLKEILVRFDRHRRTQEQTARNGRETVQPHRSSLGKHSSVWPIIHYIHQHYQDDLTLSELAERFSLSVSRISEVIKETTGQNFLHFLHDLRIRHACSLLVSTEMSVSEIALEVGYGSYNTFSRVFRESKGIVPKEYRKRK
ncbi:AraC family transcriptional regulator [Paenibacillus sp. LHD-117]|uniref:AraC family transcriptional regulator n=1 Tax=Paenibacillus sp. LHD-117 TaxID=3071412 RepID=UPI0027E212A1|nr:AraC family transcriptional regulator [Paenibacillus sp. LHD-117]MDQ6419066.1 AraC family transcriptional regulator [Paenibacillus sp. LHD-117]